MNLTTQNSTQNLFFKSDKKREFTDVLNEVQSYISSKYSMLVIDGINNVNSGDDNIKQQVKRYIGKYLLDYRISVEGLTQTELVDKLYTEMAEFSFLTKYIFGTGIEEININSWDDIEVQYSNGTNVKIDEHFESPEHAINVVRRMLHVSGMVLDNTSPAILGHLSKNIRIAVLKTPLVDEDVGVAASIRIVNAQKLKKEDFLKSGAATNDMMELLSALVRYGVSTTVAGATSSGKTTLTGWLLTTIPYDKRILTIESGSRELDLVVRDSKGKILNKVVHTITRESEDDKKLTGGDYKLMLEPIAYVTYDGVRTAVTATEAALYDLKTGGDFGSKFGPLSHKNLPLSMFLEDDDLGYNAWGGATDAKATDSDIIGSLGVGIISFKEKDEEVEVAAADYEYRVDTDVYTSVTVSGGEHTPNNPVTVRFYIKNKVYTVNNIVFPDGNSQLVWCKWHTPNTEQTVKIKVTVTGGAEASKAELTAKIVDLNRNPPPDPTADDRNDSFRAVSVPNKAQRTSAAWSVWSAYWQSKWVWHSNWRWVGSVENGHWVDYGRWVDEGEWKFRSNSYSVSMNATMRISCDEKNPTASGRTMKSGYGINEKVTASISGNGEHTELQNAVAYFPEFYYNTYWRLLEKTGSALEFRKNKYSTYNNRTHFTPIWFPDGNYKVYTWAIDCWTPAGMLSANLTDSLTIKGNVFDDWHVSPTY